MALIKYRRPLRDAIFIKQGRREGLNILLLKDAEVLPQATTPQGRYYRQMITHLPVIIFPLHHLVDNTADVTLRLHALPDRQHRVLFQKICRRQIRLVAGDIHLQYKGGGMALIKTEPHHCRGCLLQSVYIQRKTQTF